MIEEIRKRLQRVPFVPFLVRTSDDDEYSVPIHDHAITPCGNRAIVVDDRGTTNVLGLLHIDAIVDQQPNGA